MMFRARFGLLVGVKGLFPLQCCAALRPAAHVSPRPLPRPSARLSAYLGPLGSALVLACTLPMAAAQSVGVPAPAPAAMPGVPPTPAGAASALGSALGLAAESARGAVLTLSASGVVEVVQDWLSVQLEVTRDGPDATTVQAQLRQAFDAGVSAARAGVAPVAGTPGAAQFNTSGFGVYPRYGRDGRINGWQGSARLTLEGRDTARIAQLAANIPGMVVVGSSYSLSREQRIAVENQAQTQAIERFRARAQALAQAWGAAGWSLRDASFSAVDGSAPQRPLAYAQRAAVSAAAEPAPPIPTEPGRTQVMVSMSGAVVLR
jgi:predicted secreted protein